MTAQALPGKSGINSMRHALCAMAYNAKLKRIMMKINQNFNPSAQIEAYLSNVGKRSAAKPATDHSEPRSLTTDRIDLSDRAKEIYAAEKMLASVPDIRSEKVAELKAQVSSNTYHVDSRKIASGMIRESLLNAVLQY